MNHRFLVPFGAIATVVVLALLVQMPVAGQQAKAAAQSQPSKAVSSRTAWGDPDLEGVYTFSTSTPLERPNRLAHKDTYTEAELAELEEQAEASYTTEGRPEGEVAQDRPQQRETENYTNAATATLGSVLGGAADPGTYNAFWTSSEKGRLTGRTSLIMEPESGRKPELTERGKNIRERAVAETAARRIGTPPFQHILYNTWTDHPAYTRCIDRPMPRVRQSYNHGVEILQTPGYVVIHYESMHDVRIIPLDGRPHIDASIRQWDGDSRGHWEGDTLVVDWTNFSDKQEWEGAPEGNMHFTERFTRVDANVINYQVTVDDPTTWTAPWTFVVPWRADDPVYQKPEDLYEYACHEGNFRMMEDSLLGTRAVKRTLQQAEPAKK